MKAQLDQVNINNSHSPWEEWIHSLPKIHYTFRLRPYPITFHPQDRCEVEEGKRPFKVLLNSLQLYCQQPKELYSALFLLCFSLLAFLQTFHEKMRNQPRHIGTLEVLGVWLDAFGTPSTSTVPPVFSTSPLCVHP